MKIIGLTSHLTGNHDNSAALLIDGKIVFAQSEERITRIKHDTHFPINSIKETLNYKNLKLKDIDYFATGAPPTNLFKLLITYAKGFRYTNIKKIIQWVIARIALLVNEGESHQKRKGPNSLLELGINENKVIYIPHYLAHAETAYVVGGMEKCLVVAWDGYGVDEDGLPLCGSIYRGDNGALSKLEDIPVYTSLALYYGAVTVALGFKLNDGEGKTMGLAAYGKKSPVLEIVRGLFPYFNGNRWIARNNWLEMNGVSRPEYFRLTPTYRFIRLLIEEHGAEQVALAAQTVLEEEGEKFFRYLVKKYKLRKVAVAGGIFLNVKFNMRLLKNKIIDQIFIYPNPGDGGVAVGAALACYKKMGGEVFVERLESSALGKEFSDREVKKAIRSFSKRIISKNYGKQIYKITAGDIAQGKVIGWVVGRDEWGPRALGERTVLADPSKIIIKERLNERLEQRDWFMPFAPVIMDEYKDKVLVNGYATAFMTLTDYVKKPFVIKIPAAIHVDSTARSQIIRRENNEAYWQVINEFYNKTGIPVLLNTSFNKHGLPIVHSPEEAIEHLLWGCIDELVIDNYLITRKA